MNILQIAPQIPIPPTDGGKISIYGIIKGLQERGHSIDFICYRKQSNYEYSFKELKKICNPYILDVQTDNNFYRALLNLFSNVPYNASKYITKELRDFLKDFLPGKKYDIVHISHLHMGWVIDLVKKYNNSPIILRQENLEMNIMKRFSENQGNPILRFYSWLQYRKFVKYEPALCKKFDKCVMITGLDEERLLKFDDDIKTEHISSGVDSSLLLKNRNEIEPFSIVHIGHLDWYPNYDSLQWFLDEIFPQVVHSIPKAKLYVYGGCEPRNFKVPEGLSSNVIMKGFVENIWLELSTKSLAIVPLRIGSGIRIKILEMLSFGLNIVTTDIGKEGINAINERDLLIANTKEDFFNKIVDFFSGKYDAEEMVVNGKRLIENEYTWEKIAEKFEKLYESLINP